MPIKSGALCIASEIDCDRAETLAEVANLCILRRTTTGSPIGVCLTCKEASEARPYENGAETAVFTVVAAGKSGAGRCEDISINGNLRCNFRTFEKYFSAIYRHLRLSVPCNGTLLKNLRTFFTFFKIIWRDGPARVP
ncbi:MAG: hypothetical protein M3Y65_10970 [Pseudomonadota bacterium]|nr:hypothetical protein [Pseudomonadota bacterium]